jgi:PAS domain S-box-containing protein
MGYVPGLGLLGSVRKGYIPMAPSTAVSFILLGGILTALTVRSLSGASLVVLGALTVLVSIFGGLEVVGHFTGMDLNFEDALVPSAGHLGNIPIARMSPSTGGVFLLSGLGALALILRSRRTSGRGIGLVHWAGCLGALVLGTSLLFCLAYLYGSPLLYGHGATVPMALTTALAFLLLGLAIVCASGPDALPMILLTGAGRTGKSMSPKKRLLFLILIMVGACAAVMGVMTIVLYRHHIQEHREMLQVTAQSQVRLIEAVARHDADLARLLRNADPDNDAAAESLGQIAKAYEPYDGFGETGEFMLARRDGDSIVFILRYRYGAVERPAPEPFDSDLAEPMRRALKGMSGTVIELDYRGETVLAAYEPVPALNLGIVAKMDMAEIREPFIRSGLSAATVALLVVLVGTTLFFRVGKPIIARLEAYSRELEGEVEERKRTEEALQESEMRLSSFLENSAVIAWMKDEDGRHVFLSDNFQKQFQVDFNDWKGKTDFELWPREIAEEFHRNDQEVLKRGQTIEIVERATNPDGSSSWWLNSKFVFQDGSGKRYVGGLGVDITKRKQAEEQRLSLERQVQHAQKLESLGVLAGGIAHDFNNLLMVILGNSDMAMRNLSTPDIARDNIKEIEKASRRAAELSRQMLAYSGKGRFVVESVNLNEFVADMAHLLNVSISKKVELKYNFAKNPPTADCDAAQIRQIIMNLITNASEAVGDESGVIRLSTGVVDCDRASLNDVHHALLAGLEQPLSEGPYVYLEVSDTGCGMDAETIEKVFDPFFTTKFTGRGLGMAAVLGIVRGHKGAIKVQSEVGAGSTFTVLLPAGGSYPSKTAPRKRDADQTGALRGRGTILVADDEESVRDVAEQILRTMGFDVLTASDGQEAIDIFSANADAIVCVLLDLTMPRMDGEQAFIELRRIRPDITVVLCSGYSEQDATRRFDGRGLAGFIQKPYNTAELEKKLMEVLPDDKT